MEEWEREKKYTVRERGHGRVRCKGRCCVDGRGHTPGLQWVSEGRGSGGESGPSSAAGWSWTGAGRAG